MKLLNQTKTIKTAKHSLATRILFEMLQALSCNKARFNLLFPYSDCDLRDFEELLSDLEFQQIMTNLNLKMSDPVWDQCGDYEVYTVEVSPRLNIVNDEDIDPVGGLAH